MEYLETNLRELDNFPFLSTLFSGSSNPLKLMKPENPSPPTTTKTTITSGNIYSLSRSSPPPPNSPKALFHHPNSTFHGFHRDSHSHEYNLTPKINHFTTEAGSSSNAFSKISTTGNTLNNPFESSPYTPNHHHHDFMTSDCSESESVVMHGFHGGVRGFLGYHPDHQEIPHDQQIGAQSCVQLPPLVNYGEFASSSVPAMRLPSDDVPCNPFITEIEFVRRLSADEKKNKRLCARRAIQMLQKDIIKGQWSPEEDRHLVQLVGRFGIKKWCQIAKQLTGRVGKQCRERWHNHLRPDIRVSSFPS